MFVARFLTCSKVPRPLDSLISMDMRIKESLKTCSNRYWELFNNVDGEFEDVVVKTFKVGLPMNSNLWKSLTMKHTWDMYQLMDYLEVHKRIEDDQSQNKGKVKVFMLERRDPRPDRYGPSQLRRYFSIKPLRTMLMLTRHSKSLYIGYWKRLKKKRSLTSNGQIRWERTP